MGLYRQRRWQPLWFEFCRRNGQEFKREAFRIIAGVRRNQGGTGHNGLKSWLTGQQKMILWPSLSFHSQSKSINKFIGMSPRVMSDNIPTHWQRFTISTDLEYNTKTWPKPLLKKHICAWSLDAQLHLSRVSLGTYSSCSNDFSRHQDQKVQLRRDQAPTPKNRRASDNAGAREFKNRQSYCIEKEAVLLRNPWVSEYLFTWNPSCMKPRTQICQTSPHHRFSSSSETVHCCSWTSIASKISFAQPSWFNALIVRNDVYVLVLISLFQGREKNKVWPAQDSTTPAASFINTPSDLWWMPLNFPRLKAPGGSLATAHSFELFPPRFFFCTTWILMPTFSVDDRDPSVLYFGSSKAWGRYGENLAYNRTVSWLSTAGTAKISFVGELFNAFQTPLPHPTKGSSIGVYGTNYANAPNRPACIYTIDDGTPVKLTSNPTTTNKWGELFFQSPDLPSTSHVLTIKYDDHSKDSLVLDYFTINDGDPSSSLTTSILSSTTGTTLSTTLNSPVLSPSSSSFLKSESSSSFSTLESSSSSPTVTSGATPASGLATALVQGKSESKLPIGPIIGGALGALTFICTVSLILYFRRRRREGHSDKSIGAPPLAIGKNSQFLPYLIWLIIPDSLVPGRRQINPYDISQPPQHDSRGKSFADTRSGMMGMAEATTSSFVVGTLQRATTQQATAASLTSTLGNNNTMMEPNNLGGMLPIHGDPPPSYQ